MKKQLEIMKGDLFYAGYIALFFGLNAALAVFFYNALRQPINIPAEVMEMASYAGF